MESGGQSVVTDLARQKLMWHVNNLVMIDHLHLEVLGNVLLSLSHILERSYSLHVLSIIGIAKPLALSGLMKFTVLQQMQFLQDVIIEGLVFQIVDTRTM